MNMYFFYNEGKKKYFNKTNPLIVRINTRQLKLEGRGVGVVGRGDGGGKGGEKPLGIKITFPSLIF